MPPPCNRRFARLEGQGGVSAARAVAQATLDGLRGLKTDVGARRQRLESLFTQAEIDIAAAATSPRPRPKTWLALSALQKPHAAETSQSAEWNRDVAALRCAAIMLRGLEDRVAAIAEPLKDLESDLKDLIAAFAETADDDIGVFLDAHPELVAQLDQEWRMEFLGGQGQSSALSKQQESAGRNCPERLRCGGRAKVLDTFRRGDFRELLPGGRGASPLDPRLLKSCLEERHAPSADVRRGPPPLVYWRRRSP